jgi:hypothetical protein
MEGIGSGFLSGWVSGRAVFLAAIVACALAGTSSFVTEKSVPKVSPESAPAKVANSAPLVATGADQALPQAGAIISKREPIEGITVVGAEQAPVSEPWMVELKYPHVAWDQRGDLSQDARPVLRDLGAKARTQGLYVRVIGRPEQIRILQSVRAELLTHGVSPRKAQILMDSALEPGDVRFKLWY